ncbi:MAG: hypothetical protein ACLQUY_09160 [Ktedonobacterales bacterium]
MYAVLEQYGGYVLAGVWMVGGVILGIRNGKYRSAYLQRFPPVNGVPLYMTWHGNPFGSEARAIYRAALNRQPDPDVERMRRELWRRYGQICLWIFGFPVLAFGVAALVLTIFPH